MKNAVEFIISSIVDHPDKVTVEEVEEDGTVNFIVHVAQEDMGKVIGKEGKVIKAIRNVLKIPAIKQGKRVHISLEELPA